MSFTVDPLERLELALRLINLSDEVKLDGETRARLHIFADSYLKSYLPPLKKDDKRD